MINNKIQYIGDRIRLKREELGFSQSGLSEMMSLSRTMCGQWERGTSIPSTLHLSRLADILGVSFEYLAKGAVDESNKNEVLLSNENQEKILNARAIKLIENMPFDKKQALIDFLSHQ
jgi:transcriptional regulator with XRE-family HTH domain